MGKAFAALLWFASAVFVAGYTWKSYELTYSQFPDSSSNGGIGGAIAGAGAAKYLLEKKGGRGTGPEDGGKGTSGDGETPKGSGGGSWLDWIGNASDWVRNKLGMGGGKSGGKPGGVPEGEPIPIEPIP